MTGKNLESLPGNLGVSLASQPQIALQSEYLQKVLVPPLFQATAVTVFRVITPAQLGRCFIAPTTSAWIWCECAPLESSTTGEFLRSRLRLPTRSGRVPQPSPSWRLRGNRKLM